MLVPVGLILLLLAVRGQCEDTVVANVGGHTVSRIADMLSASECRQLQGWLLGPDKDLDEQELERLSEKQNPIGPPRHRRRRDLRDPVGCSEALRDWLRTVGEVTTWDRLARGLRHIGRSDLAWELGKNLNQDRILELRKNVEEYGQGAQHSSSTLLWQGQQPQGARGRRALPGDLGDLSVQRRLPPPYTRSLLDWVGPLISGILGGFFGSLLFTVAAVTSCRWMLALDT